MSLKRCYEITNGSSSTLIIKEDSPHLKLIVVEENKTIVFIMRDAEIEELLKSIDMLRPERPLNVKENPLKAIK